MAEGTPKRLIEIRVCVSGFAPANLGYVKSMLAHHWPFEGLSKNSYRGIIHESYVTEEELAKVIREGMFKVRGIAETLSDPRVIANEIIQHCKDFGVEDAVVEYQDWLPSEDWLQITGR